MIKFDARKLGFEELNKQVREAKEDNIEINDCFGERFIGSGAHAEPGSPNKTITINGTPGNALGSYLDGAKIVVNGNAQDAVGDTMNHGTIVVHGNAGDALGYAMRGGKIFVKGNAGYRAGIHMKQYKEKLPIIVIGGSVGSFLGEYQAGGLLVVLGLDSDEFPTGNFTGTGMHGGKMFIRSSKAPTNLPEQVSAEKATEDDMKEIYSLLDEFSEYFNIKKQEILNKDFYLLTPNAKNPYKQLYTQN